jgi:hypothetical protein
VPTREVVDTQKGGINKIFGWNFVLYDSVLKTLYFMIAFSKLAFDCTALYCTSTL